MAGMQCGGGSAHQHSIRQHVLKPRCRGEQAVPVSPPCVGA